eukprot:TRINITY_DN937_c0_g1_i1.p1 TRINITY_DN937_c0_g1~~TRINITY_DN937_c0_g1_i1.p1  ORF type:complete len:304 (+),score=98.43 TRINITY_DN937_c0_g1_i1:43-912(+)
MPKASKAVRSKPAASTWVGDMTNVLIIVNSLAFMAFVVLQTESADGTGMLSSLFSRDGICVSNQDKSVYVQSHALCFYLDTACVVVLLLWCRALRARGYAAAALDPVTSALFGMFLHGAAHMGVGLNGKMGHGGPVFQRYPDPVGRLQAVGGMLLFWCMVTIGQPLRMVRRGRLPLIVLVAVASWAVHILLVPERLEFTYVSTSILMVFGISSLLVKGTDTRFYSGASLAMLPVGLVAWAEALLCESLLQPVGGHIWYDLSMPIGHGFHLLWVMSKGPDAHRRKASRQG